MTVSFDARMVGVDNDRARPRFVSWLKEWMELRGLGVRQTAKYAGISASALSTILRGEGGPSYLTAVKLADFFKVDRAIALDLAGFQQSGGEATHLGDIDIEDPSLNIQLWLEAYKELTPEELRSIKDLIRWQLERSRKRRQAEGG